MSNTSPTTCGPFSASAEIYDQVYGYQANETELAPYRRWLGEPRPPRNRLVEYGCGTGRFAKSLQDLGWHVLGVEPNRAMLTHAWRKGITAVQADIGTGLVGPHDAVVAPFSVLGYVGNQSEMLACLRKIRAWAARAGTRLCFDLVNRRCAEHHLEPFRSRELPDGNVRRDTREFRAGVLHSQVAYGPPNSIPIWTEYHSQWTYTAADVALMLECSGWRHLAAVPRDAPERSIRDTDWQIFYAAEAI